VAGTLRPGGDRIAQTESGELRGGGAAATAAFTGGRRLVQAALVPLLPAGWSQPPSGHRLAAEWHRYFDRPVDAPYQVEEQIQSWDCAFKDLDTSDYVVGQAWARVGSSFLLADQVRARMDCPGTLKAVRELSRKWPRTYAKLIEDKANGSAVIQMLGRELPGLLPVNPEGGKSARAAAVSPLIEAGNVYLPHPLCAPWVNDFIEECAAFPNGAHDDQDAMTQALIRWNQLPDETVVYLHEPYQISAI
jgi:predicted phage terminase large subunit-like protein